MNPNEIEHYVVLLLVASFSSIATKYGIDGATVTAIATGLVAAGAAAVSIYRNTNMKKVPEAAVVVKSIPVLALALLGLLAFNQPAAAADLTRVKATALAPVTQVSDCTQQECSGWIAGVNIMGSGSNADILGSGLNGSVFAGGGLIGFDGGGQLWNGKFFGGFLASIDYDANMSGVLPNQGRVLGMVLLQAGVGLSGIFTPSAAPIGIPDKIAAALVSPYLNFGAAIRARGDAWVSGAGAEFDLSSAWLLRLDYLHLDYSHGQAAPGLGAVVSPSSVENLVKATLLRRFDTRFLGS